MSKSPAGDIKLELFGDGESFDPDKGALHVVGLRPDLRRLEQLPVRHLPAGGARRRTQGRAAATFASSPNRSYHFTITRQGGAHRLERSTAARSSRWTDPEPLAGAGHEYLAVDDWEAELSFDNLTDSTRPLIEPWTNLRVPRSISIARWPASPGRRSLLIYTHDNPDPDALAAALGLQRLAEHELDVERDAHLRRHRRARARTGRWSRT